MSADWDSVSAHQYPRTQGSSKGKREKEKLQSGPITAGEVHIGVIGTKFAKVTKRVKEYTPKK